MTFDLHTHSTWSDGELIPAELVQRAKDKGYGGVAITDHADASNLELIVTSLKEFVKACARVRSEILVVAGVELTHNPPGLIPELVREARRLGAGIIVVHGETPVEPVPEGTNRAAIEAMVDVLAHPGLISEADVKLAAKRGVALEITARKGHNITNGRLCSLIRKFKAPFVFDTDSHAPGDFFSKDLLAKVALGAGFSQAELRAGQKRAEALLRSRAL